MRINKRITPINVTNVSVNRHGMFVAGIYNTTREVLTLALENFAHDTDTLPSEIDASLAIDLALIDGALESVNCLNYGGKRVTVKDEGYLPILLRALPGNFFKYRSRGFVANRINFKIKEWGFLFVEPSYCFEQGEIVDVNGVLYNAPDAFTAGYSKECTLEELIAKRKLVKIVPTTLLTVENNTIKNKA